MTNEEIQKIVMKSEKEYEELKDTLHEQYNEIQDLKKRIDKAVEYIANKPFMDIPQLLELANILKGDDNDK